MGNLLNRFEQILTMSEEPSRANKTGRRSCDEEQKCCDQSADNLPNDLASQNENLESNVHKSGANSASADQGDNIGSNVHIGQGDGLESNILPAQDDDSDDADLNIPAEGSEITQTLKLPINLKRSSSIEGQNLGPTGKQRCHRKSDVSCDHHRLGQSTSKGGGDGSVHSDLLAACSSSSSTECIPSGSSGSVGSSYYKHFGSQGEKLTSGTVRHINDLPHAILVRIFKYINMKELLQTVVLVCKFWRCLTQDSDLWRFVSLKGFQKANDDTLCQLTSFSDNVTSVDLSDVTSTTTQGVIDMLKGCTRLRRLKLTRNHHLQNEAFQAIGEHCPDLRVLYLDCCFQLNNTALISVGGGCSKLEELYINQCSRINGDGIVAVAQGCPKLHTFVADECYQVNDSALNELASRCAGLKCMNLMGCSITEDGIMQLVKLKNLESLELSNVGGVTRASVEHITLNCRNLRSLNLSLCSCVDDSCVKFIAKHAKKLTSLMLVSCPVSDAALRSICEDARQIQSLDVGWCQQITDEGATYIAETCKELRYLGLMRCDRVSIPTTEQLVEKYTRIHFSTMFLDCKRLIERARQAGCISGPLPWDTEQHSVAHAEMA